MNRPSQVFDCLARDPSGPTYFGTIGLDASNWSLEGYVPPQDRDAVNTVENIFIRYPQAGLWYVKVRAHEINEDAHSATPEHDVPYALVVSVDFDCDNNGVPDSQEWRPSYALECPSGSGGGTSGGGEQQDPYLPCCGGPGTGAQ